MKNTIVWIVVIVVLALGVFWYMNRPVAPVVVALSEQNGSGMSGTATLTEMNGSTLVALSLTGAPAGVVQPAHIHTGSCANIGAVVYPLTSPVDGVSETTLNVSLDAVLAQLPLALNVHKSVKEVSVYVACGDITK